MMKKLEKVLMPLAEAIGRNKYLMSIRDGFLLSTPLLIGGSIFLLIANFPIPAWIEFLEGTVVNQATGQTLASYIAKPADATFTIMAVFAVMGIAYSFAEKLGTNKLFGAATALVSWFLIMPYTVTGEVDVNGVAQAVSLTGVPLGWLGAKGIFVGIFCAFISVHIYTFVEKRGWTIKMPAGVPPTVEESFAALIPAAVVMIIFFAVNLIFGYMGTDVFQIIFEFLHKPWRYIRSNGNSLHILTYILVLRSKWWICCWCCIQPNTSDSICRKRSWRTPHNMPAVPGFIRNIWWCRFNIITSNSNVIIL